MRYIKILYYRFQEWRLHRKADQYIEYEWFQESLDVSNKALQYGKKIKDLQKP